MKLIIILLLILLTIYAPIELSRKIFEEMWVRPHMQWQFIFEYYFIWLLYLSAIAILRRVIK